ncbi:MAG TPA: VOC family protein [Candidatus Bathyarchaeia archaeon]|nr:VOC family protein [Candidatus Bathyarchaeia archaeon]
MPSKLYHLQVNVSSARVALPFYRDLLGYLGWRSIVDEGNVVAFSDGGVTLWLFGADARFAGRGFHRKGAGLNHLAFLVDRREDVDRFREQFMVPRSIAPLYATPREFPEYVPGYYAVFFEGPDRLKLEVVYRPFRAG